MANGIIIPKTGTVAMLGMTDGVYWRMWNGTQWLICDGTNGTPDRSAENALLNPPAED